MKENIEILATCFERIRPYRMNEARKNGEVSAAIESMGKHHLEPEAAALPREEAEAPPA